jgi:hypothetical protein
MGKLKILNNILPKEINNKIINELANHHWFIAWDNAMNRKEKIFSKKNNGFSIITMSEGREQMNSILNVYGEIIFNLIIKKLKVKGVLDRIFWNMYLKESETELHTDRPYSNYFSVVYNLHTTDGGTEIDNKFYPDLEGQAKIFNSNTLHRGLGPKQDNVRFNLNLVFKI